MTIGAACPICGAEFEVARARVVGDTQELKVGVVIKCPSCESALIVTEVTDPGDFKLAPQGS